MIKVRFLSPAEDEFLAEVAYYSKAREGLGLRFQSAVQAVVAKAAINPQRHALFADGARRARIKGFPFTLVYHATTDELIVIAVAHDSRRPDYWRDRAP